MRIETYQDAKGETRWRAIGDNDADVVADSGEGYKNREDAEGMARKLFGEDVPMTHVEPRGNDGY